MKEDLRESDSELVREAIATSDRLYLQGANEVAAAVRTSNGVVYSAIHFETKVGFANVCGEVAAVCCMLAAGHRDLDTVVAVWRDEHGGHFVLPPCGRCREVISEFNPDAWIILSSNPNPWAADAIATLCRVSLRELLPFNAWTAA
jgi:cytidine deaminase